MIYFEAAMHHSHEFIAEAVVVVLHPGQKGLSSCFWIGASRLARQNPDAKEAACKRAEFPIRVVDFLGLQVAGGDEGLIENSSTRGTAGRQGCDLALHVLQTRYEGSPLAPVSISRKDQGFAGFLREPMAGLQPALFAKGAKAF